MLCVLQYPVVWARSLQCVWSSSGGACVAVSCCSILAVEWARGLQCVCVCVWSSVCVAVV